MMSIKEYVGKNWWWLGLFGVVLYFADESEDALESIVNRCWNWSNRMAQWTIGIIAFWPIVIILAALAGSPAFSTIVAIIPALAFIGVLITRRVDPVLVALLGIITETKTLMQWAYVVITAELAIGFYFAVVPASSKPGLILLLVLACVILLFLYAGTTGKKTTSGLAKFVKFVMIMTIIIITINFVGIDREWWGGKPKPTKAGTEATPQSKPQPKQAEWAKDPESGLLVKQTSHEVVSKEGAKIKKSIVDGNGTFTRDCKDSPLYLEIDVAPGEEVEVRHIVESIAKMNRCSYDMRGNAHPVAEAASMIVFDKWRNDIFFPDLPPYSYVFSLGKPGESQIAKIFEAEGEHITLQNNTDKALPLYFTFNYINKKDWMRQVGWDGSSISFEAVKL